MKKKSKNKCPELYHYGTNRRISWDTKIMFGKHSGSKIQDILIDNPKYLVWLIENTTLSFSTKMRDYIYSKAS